MKCDMIRAVHAARQLPVQRRMFGDETLDGRFCIVLRRLSSSDVASRTLHGPAR